MRHRIDAGSGLVAVGAAVLLVSLFLDWYEPQLSAWTSFEIVDLALAILAVGALVGTAGLTGPEAAMVRWGPLASLAAVVLVASQLVDPPPGVGDAREAGAWLALAAAVTMGVGSLLTVASIAVTVDVRGRDRRAVAVDRRADDEKAAEQGADPDRPTVADRRERGDEQAGPVRDDDRSQAVTDRATQAFETFERPSDADADTSPLREGEGESEPSDAGPAPRDRPAAG